MTAAAYLLGLCCALPMLGFALGVLAFGHAVESKSVLELFSETGITLVWGLPALLCAVVALASWGFSQRWRVIGSGVLIVLNVAAIVVVLRVTGPPHTIGAMAMLGPTAISCWIHGRLLLRWKRDRSPHYSPKTA